MQEAVIKSQQERYKENQESKEEPREREGRRKEWMDGWKEGV